MVSEYLHICFSGANLPASMLLAAVMFYWLLAIVAALDLDFLHFDLNLDGQADLPSVLGGGFVAFRFLNLGRVPVMIWLSVFALAYWGVSMLFDRLLDDPEHREVLLIAAQRGVRNLVIAVGLTKVLTQPLRGKFDAREPNPAESLIGQSCVVTTSEVTRAFGQAEYTTDAAPLLLNVRSQETPLAKGDVAVIVDYDPEENIYFVTKANSEV